MPKITYTGYGFFPGGDPRDFSPDGDSSPEEIENHRRACEAWDRGERQSRSDCIHGEGIILTSCQYGLGSYTATEDVSWSDWARDRIGALRCRIYWALPARVRCWIAAREGGE
jgi:hypothetical protein